MTPTTPLSGRSLRVAPLAHSAPGSVRSNTCSVQLPVRHRPSMASPWHSQRRSEGARARRRPRSHPLRSRRCRGLAGTPSDFGRGLGGAHSDRRTTRADACSRSRPPSNAVLDATSPDAVAVERVFSQHNVRTVMGVAQVSGVVITAAARRGLAGGLHTPSEVKAAVTGHGRADKDQVGAMVARVLGLDGGAQTGGRRRRIGARDLSRVAQASPGTPGGAGRCSIVGVHRGPTVIASVRGEVLDVSPEPAVIEVGGLGLAIQCTPPTLATLRRGEHATVHTSLVVREDSLTLYGFADADERAVFEVAADRERSRAATRAGSCRGASARYACVRSSRPRT